MAWATASTFSGGWPASSLAGDLGAGLGMVRRHAVTVAPGHVVEQGCRAHDLQVGALGLGQALGQGQHAQDVVKIVDGIGALVVLASFFKVDHVRLLVVVSSKAHYTTMRLVAYLFG